MAKEFQTLRSQLSQITSQLREVLAMEPSPVVLDSGVLRFELAYEVLWKTLQAHATWLGLLVQSPREALKHGHKSGLINDWDTAEEMMKDRNLLVHTYDIEAARRVHARLPAYLAFIEAVLVSLPQPPS